MLAANRFYELEKLLKNWFSVDDTEENGHGFKRYVIAIVRDAHFPQTFNDRVNVNWKQLTRLHHTSDGIKPISSSESSLRMSEIRWDRSEFPFIDLLLDGRISFQLIVLLIDSEILIDTVARFYHVTEVIGKGFSQFFYLFELLAGRWLLEFEKLHYVPNATSRGSFWELCSSCNAERFVFDQSVWKYNWKRTEDKLASFCFREQPVNGSDQVPHALDIANGIRADLFKNLAQENAGSDSLLITSNLDMISWVEDVTFEKFQCVTILDD